MIKDFSFADGNDDAYIQYSVNGGLMIKDFSFADAPALFLWATYELLISGKEPINRANMCKCIHSFFKRRSWMWD